MTSDTPAGPAETDLMARLADTVRQAPTTFGRWPDVESPNSQDMSPEFCEHVANEVLRTLAAMPEPEAFTAALAAGRDALRAAWSRTHLNPVDTRDEVFLRAASPLLLARQAGEMERMREELNEAKKRSQGHLDDKHAILDEFEEARVQLAALRAQLRAAEGALEQIAAMPWPNSEAPYAQIARAALPRPAAPAEEGPQ